MILRVWMPYTQPERLKAVRLRRLGVWSNTGRYLRKGKLLNCKRNNWPDGQYRSRAGAEDGIAFGTYSSARNRLIATWRTRLRLGGGSERRDRHPSIR